MKQTLRKPENWQDFEELCKKLWEEIWICAEIKKNGRSGQQQYGVDIYGIPSGAKGYYGIQCKGKDDYTNAILTVDEIEQEIKKAQTFKPQLVKLYFATTANKDTKIEEFVRVKNIEQIEAGLFEVHLFSWEDIVYLIDQNKRTYDWYVRKIDFATEFDVQISFENDDDHLEYHPRLVKHYIKYQYQKETNPITLAIHHRTDAEVRKRRIEIDTEPQPKRHFVNGTSSNKASCVFAIKVKNIGNESLESLKLYLSFNDECYTSDRVFKQYKFLDTTKYDYNIQWIPQTENLEFKPADKILVQDDIIVSDRICLRPNIEFPFTLTIPWKLVAKGFNRQGILKASLYPQITIKNSIKVVSEHLEDEIVLENLS